jgi:alpha-galactosidase
MKSLRRVQFWYSASFTGWAVLMLLAVSLSAAPSPAPLIEQLQTSRPFAVAVQGETPAKLTVEGRWKKGTWSGVVRNDSDQPVALREVVLFEAAHGLPAASQVYGESFQMLAQITGTLQAPLDLGSHTDRKHYKIPEPPGYRVASGLLTLAPAADQALGLAFISCNKFIGRIGFNETRLKVYLETEGLSLPAHSSWKLEDFACFTGQNRDAVLQQVAAAVQKNHPRKLPAQPPIGWCSWYTFYEDVTVPDIQRNLAFAKKNLPQLRYIQIDDGYQSKMGDWLETGTAFGGNIQSVLKEIRATGFEPAIWLAPFIAEKTSLVFQQHPDWFIKGPDGKPLDSSTVGFGGWRCAPWYVLDGTHPEVQKHLENVARTMRQQWGVTYFKLDANYWGAIHGGTHYNPQATRIDAYRQGMQAILRGAGDAFILGCNAPIWPSLGLVDGMRTSGDINNTWKAFNVCGLENLARSWQNGRLWWSDPDCLLLTENTQQNIRKNKGPRDPSLTDKEFKLHVASLRASGGMVLSGDELAQISPERFAVLKKMLAPTGKAMSFATSEFAVGRVSTGKKTEEIALFNWGDTPVTRTVTVKPGSTVTDFWTGEARVVPGDTLSYDLPARSAVLVSVKAKKSILGTIWGN